MKGKIRRDSRSYHYFFVMPATDRKADVHKAAKSLMSIREVKEVAITEGDYGFIVRTDPLYDDEALLNKEITKVVGGSTRSVLCHCKYLK